MQYLGGKSRIRKQLIPVIQAYVTNRYVEPFCGACWIGEMVQANVRILTDLNAPLIEMWKELQKGWIPPNEVDEDWYKYLKNTQEVTAIAGFVGFTCSFGGKFYGGYARGALGRNYAKNGANSLLRRIPNLMSAKFGWANYIDVMQRLKAGDVCYCDPPYSGTTKYYGLPEMNYEEFWEICRQASQRGVIVLVSEYSAPDDFEAILTIQTKTDMNTKEGKEIRLEKLFKWR